MTRISKIARRVAVPIAATFLATLPALAQDTRADVNAELTAMMGGVPSFVGRDAQLPADRRPGRLAPRKLRRQPSDTPSRQHTLELLRTHP